MVTKIGSAALLLTIVFMGVKQGMAMMTGNPEMLEMFGKWDFGKLGVMVFGALTLLSTVLIIVPKTFVWGNFLMAATILFIICFQLFHGNLKGAAVEVPFLLLNLIVLYLRHPLNS